MGYYVNHIEEYQFEGCLTVYEATPKQNIDLWNNKGKQKMKKRTDILFLLPSRAGFAVFFIVPFIYIFYYAFTENAFSGKFAGF